MATALAETSARPPEEISERYCTMVYLYMDSWQGDVTPPMTMTGLVIKTEYFFIIIYENRHVHHQSECLHIDASFFPPLYRGCLRIKLTVENVADQNSADRGVQSL